MQEAPIPDSRTLRLKDAAATRAFGEKLGARLKPGDVVCLWGGLGAGKTTFARGAIAAWTGDPDQEVPSPTYTLVQTYESPRGLLLHMDLYRLKSSEEAWELGLEDMAGQVSLIEWPERLGTLLPKDRLDIALSGEGAGQDEAGRLAQCTAHGKWRERFDVI